MKKNKSRIAYRVAAGVMDVFGAAAAALAILVLTLMLSNDKSLRVDTNTLLYQVPGGMLSNLISWLRQDLAITFSDLTDNITEAVIIDKK